MSKVTGFETADRQVRIYPSTYKELKRLADKRRTTIAQILLEVIDREALTL